MSLARHFKRVTSDSRVLRSGGAPAAECFASARALSSCFHARSLINFRTSVFAIEVQSPRAMSVHTIIRKYYR